MKELRAASDRSQHAQKDILAWVLQAIARSALKRTFSRGCCSLSLAARSKEYPRAGAVRYHSQHAQKDILAWVLLAIARSMLKR
ncbi:MAG: hypothetical protein RSG59_09950 [Ruthenibacterium sp.]